MYTTTSLIIKKAFDRVLNNGVWRCMENVGISQEIINIIESLYANLNSAIILNNMTGDFFHTTIGVRQGCLLSPMLFNIFLEQLCKKHFKTKNQLYLLVADKLTTLDSPTI